MRLPVTRNSGQPLCHRYAPLRRAPIVRPGIEFGPVFFGHSKTAPDAFQDLDIVLDHLPHVFFALIAVEETPQVDCLPFVDFACPVHV